MSEVKKGYECTCSWSPCHHSHIEKRQSDLDRVTAERDAALGCEAALREEISALKHPMNSAVQARAERDALQQRLTAADERADVLEGHYFELKEAARQLIDNAVDDEGAGEMVVQRADIDELRPLIAALKPAEGRGDE